MQTLTRIARPLFHTVAVLEALSWIGLLASMYHHYVADGSRAGIEAFGPLHGGVFVAYVLVTLLASRTLGWSLGTTLIALVASIPPLATVVVDVWASRTGRLDARAVRGGARTPA